MSPLRRGGWLGTLSGPQGELTKTFALLGFSDQGPPNFPDCVFCFVYVNFTYYFPINHVEMYDLLAFSAFPVLYPPPSRFSSPQKDACYPFIPPRALSPSFLGVTFTLVCMWGTSQLSDVLGTERLRPVFLAW